MRLAANNEEDLAPSWAARVPNIVFGRCGPRRSRGGRANGRLRQRRPELRRAHAHPRRAFRCTTAWSSFSRSRPPSWSSAIHRTTRRRSAASCIRGSAKGCREFIGLSPVGWRSPRRGRPCSGRRRARGRSVPAANDLRRSQRGHALHPRGRSWPGRHVLFDSEEEAVRIANATPYGLAGSVWTRDMAAPSASQRREVRNDIGSTATETIQTERRSAASRCPALAASWACTQFRRIHRGQERFRRPWLIAWRS